MPNPAIAALIAERLPTGLPHPGRPAENQPPVPLVLPGFATTGMSAQQAESVNATAIAFAEAVVNLIETDGKSTIIANTELAQLRTMDEQPGGAVPILCEQCNQPMFHLKAKGERLMMNASTVKALGRVRHVCEVSA